MKFTNGDAYELYMEYTSYFSKSTSKDKKADAAAAKFIEVHVPYGNHQSIKIKFSRLLESKPGDKCTREVVQKWEETLFFDIDTIIVPSVAPVDDDVKQKEDGGAQKPSSITKKQRLLMREAVSSVEQFATELNISKEEALQRFNDECRRVWKRKYVCEVCDKQCANSNTLKSHRRIHTGEKPHICTHTPCTFTTSSKSSLTRHIRNKHTHEKPYKCPMCEKAFTSINMMKRHSLIHTGEKPYVCEHCGRTFSRKFNLATHVRLHTGDKPYGCDRCGKTFAQLAGRNQHIQHCNGVPASLAEVGESNQHIQGKMDHMQLSTSPGHTFSQFSGLSQHIENCTHPAYVDLLEKKHVQYTTSIATPASASVQYVLPTPAPLPPETLPSIPALSSIHSSIHERPGMF